MKIGGALSGLVLEELGEMGEVGKTEIIGNFLDRLICVKQQSFCFCDDPFMNHLQRCFGAMAGEEVGDGFG